MKGHVFVEDPTYRLYTVYIIEMKCGDATWNVYRRYREFTALYDKVRCNKTDLNMRMCYHDEGWLYVGRTTRIHVVFSHKT